MSLIFKDRNKLSPRYIPKELPHREEQLKDLLKFYIESLENRESIQLKTYQIIGDVGTGKTVTTLRFGELIQEEGKRLQYEIKCVYINPKQHGSSRLLLFRHIVQQVEPNIFSVSYSAEELMIELMKFLNKTNKYLIIIFDEIDYALRYIKEPLIYNLTRLNEVLPEKRCNVIGIIFTARNNEYLRRLDRAELSTLGRFYVEFKPYTAKQIYDILEKRVEEAFYPGKVTEEVIEFIADVTAAPPINGDVRYALDLLLYSGRLAENRGEDRIKVDHVRYVLGVTSPIITEEDILYLPDTGKIVLLSIARALRKKRNPYIRFDEIVDELEEVKKEFKIKSLALKDVVKNVQDLEYRGIIEVKGLTEIGITRVPVEKLNNFLDMLIKRLASRS